MRWPWTKSPQLEKRDSAGSFSDAVARLLDARAAGTVADVSKTAAVEAASGALSRAFGAAEVVGTPMVKEIVSPTFLSQVGRDLIRNGQSMHVLAMSANSKLILLPCSSWHFEGEADPDSWMVRATVYGPSTSTTRYLPRAGVVFVTWGSTPGEPYVGRGPLSWASVTAQLQSETQRSLADEASGPLAQIIALPVDGGDDEDEDDPQADLKRDIAKARGRAILVETTQASYGTGGAPPQRDWVASRLGPNPPAAMPTIDQQIYKQVLAACGCSVAMFDDSDGTSKREAQRVFLHGTVKPLTKLLSAELSERLETDITLNMDALYYHDLAGRASSFQRMVAGGMEVEKAASISGLMVVE